PLRDPVCYGLEELAGAKAKRSKVARPEEVHPASPLFHHLSQGLALTIGSALGSTPPDTAACLSAFLIPNKAHLTAGARAWSKHAHRSQPLATPSSPHEETIPEIDSGERSDGWWGRPSGPVASINERALALFWKVVGGATWRNLHWLPHRVLVYEVRVEEGYGMRWSQDQSAMAGEDGSRRPVEDREGAEGVLQPWTFRGFVEPMMENGHELGWRH
ncbi:hypothetical protein FA13DRAFT_1579390, partial [Coprinellus micaceus]